MSSSNKDSRLLARFFKKGKIGQDENKITSTKLSKAIGIDLGTTNSVAAIKKVYTEILQNAEGEELTPSCVTQQNGKFIIGSPALAWMKQDPENTIVSIKRIIGRPFVNEEVQKIISEQKVSYKIKPLSTGTENSIAVVLNDQEYTPEQISSIILKKIKRDCEKIVGEEVTDAVITIPAYFNDKQKHATRVAATLAGFRVQRLLPEPTAAAISFGIEQTDETRGNHIMVYDFGGGTLDISILTIAEGQFIEQGKGGDMWLGGNDIDVLIIKYVYQQAGKEYDKNIKELVDKLPKEQKSQFLGELKEKVEKAKIELSDKEKTHFDILGILKDEHGNIINIDIELARFEFERLVLPMVGKSITLAEEVIHDLGFTPDLIDKILLVGGSSRIPLVINKMKEKFGHDKVMVHDRPMLSISEGAAILAHRLSGKYECPGCGYEVLRTDCSCKECGFNLEKHLLETGIVDIVHSTAHDYYIYLENNPQYLLVAKNTPLPVEKTEVFELVDANQKLIHMKFFNLVNEEEDPIGDLWLGIDVKSEDEENPWDSERIEKEEVILNFRIDENNIIEVFASLKSHPDIKVLRTLSRGKADEKLFISVEESIKDINATQISHHVVYDFVNRTIDIVKDINMIVDPNTNEVNEDVYRNTSRRLDVANKLAKSERSPQGMINYAHNVLSFNNLISPEEARNLETVIKKVEQVKYTGSFEEIERSMNNLTDELNKYPFISTYIALDKAYSYCRTKNAAQAEKILNYKNQLWEYTRNGEVEEVQRFLKEIMPEISNINAIGDLATQPIHKGIVK